MTQVLENCDPKDRWAEFFGWSPENNAASYVTKSQMMARQRETNTTTGMVPVPTLVLLDEIWSADRVLKLREAVQADMYWADGLWTCELTSLRIMGYGESQDQAVEDFFEDFFATYDGLVHENDSSLTVDARLAKRALQDLVLASVPAHEIARGLVGRI
jgi:hypothetical protein